MFLRSLNGHLLAAENPPACLKHMTPPCPHASLQILRVYRDLDATLRILVPRKSVVLAFDGPGPVAKLLTQRKRRSKASKASKYKLSGLNITPGTTFMRMVMPPIRASGRARGSHLAPHAAREDDGPNLTDDARVRVLRLFANGDFVQVPERLVLHLRC